MTRSIQSGKALERDLVAIICAETGATSLDAARFIEPVVRYLQREYGGNSVYIPKEGRLLDVAQIRREFAQRVPARVICRSHSISSRTLYRLLDGDDPELE